MARFTVGLQNESRGRSGDPDDAGDPDEPLDLAGALRIVDEAERSARRQLGGNTALVYLAWGLAWLVGYGALEGSRRGWLPLELATALVVHGVSLTLALASTVVLTTRGNRGIRGHSAFQGGMYGASWGLGFLIMGILSGIIGRTVEDFWLSGMLTNSIAVLIAGLLYITGGTTFNDRRQSYLGVWLLVVTIAALMSGPEYFLTVFLYLGSGGLLAGSLLEFLGNRRRKTVVSDA